MIAFLVDSILQFANTKTDHCVEIPAFAIPYYDLTFVLDGTMVASVDKGIHNKTTKYGLPTY